MHRLQRLGQTPCEVQLNQDKQQCTPNGIRQVAPSGSAHYSFRLFHLIVEAQACATPVDVIVEDICPTDTMKIV